LLGCRLETGQPDELLKKSPKMWCPNCLLVSTNT
jgi:hypothetical protein